MEKLTLLGIGLWVLNIHAQNIEMNFPYFKGKNYDFVIFQGAKTKMVFQGIIPEDGKFTLSVPKEYAPYTGMSRWLITGTQEGGGLDLLIPGHNFSVSCKESQPNEQNINYINNNEISQLNNQYKKQQTILSKYEIMLQATKIFRSADKNYPLFEEEVQNQLKSYQNLQQELERKNDYPSKFINIVNITKGIGTTMQKSEEGKAKDIARYIAQKLDWKALYTSGHWTEVISSWADMHALVLRDSHAFAKDVETVGVRIQDPVQYKDFAESLAIAFTRSGKDEFIEAITPVIKASGKITDYQGYLAVYGKGTVGSQAPDLILKNKDAETQRIKSSELAGPGNEKTLLVFYESDCGACKNLLEELPGKNELLKRRKVRIISISADTEREVFKEKSKNFPWQEDVYCDYEGFNGSNFKNYGVQGTPTMFVVDKTGTIILRTASLQEVLDEK